MVIRLPQFINKKTIKFKDMRNYKKSSVYNYKYQIANRFYNFRGGAILPRKLKKFVNYWINKFFLRKFRNNWVRALSTLIGKWSHKLRYKRNYIRRLQLFSFTKMAAERLTRLQCLCFFKVVRWHVRIYKALRKHVLFERYRSKPFFLQILVAVHYTISQGVPGVLLDFIRWSLSQLAKHNSLLGSVNAAVRYFICYSGTSILRKDICYGVRIFVIGKINGSRRRKKLVFLFGRIPTSFLTANIRYDQTRILTRYGALHVHIWLYYKPLLQVIEQRQLV